MFCSRLHKTRSAAFDRGRSTLYRSLKLEPWGQIDPAGACDFSRSTCANFSNENELPNFAGTRVTQAVGTVAFLVSGSACGPVIVPVFKTGERQAILSLVGSTPTRFRQYLSMHYIDGVLTGSYARRDQ
jgi:hypothetical protein